MEGYGVYALAFSLGVFSSVVADAGGNSIVIQRIAKKEAVKKTVNMYFGSFLAIKSILYLATTMLVTGYVLATPMLTKNLYIFLIYQGFGFVLCMQPMFLFIIWNRLHISSLLIIITKLPVLAYVLLFFEIEAGQYEKIALLDFVMMILAVIMQYIYVHKSLGFWPVIESRLFWPLLNVLKYFFLTNLASATYHRLHYFFVVVHGDPKALGLISIIDRIISTWGQLYNPAVTILIPRLVRLKETSIHFLNSAKCVSNRVLIFIIALLVLLLTGSYFEVPFLSLNSTINNEYYDANSVGLYLMIGLLCLTNLSASMLGYPVATITGQYYVSQFSIFIGFTVAILIAVCYTIFNINLPLIFYALTFMIFGELAVLSTRSYYLNKFTRTTK